MQAEPPADRPALTIAKFDKALHDRSAFVDDPAQPRLLYRARFLDRATAA